MTFLVELRVLLFSTLGTWPKVYQTERVRRDTGWVCTFLNRLQLRLTTKEFFFPAINDPDTVNLSQFSPQFSPYLFDSPLHDGS